MRRAQVCQWTLDVVSEKSKAYRDTRGPGLPAVRAMLKAAARQSDQRKAARDVAIIRLLNDLGLRRSELVGLDIPDHVERDATGMPSTILVRGKGSSERSRLTLPPKTASSLGAWIAGRGVTEGPLFLSLDPGAGRVGRGGRARALDERLTGEGVTRILTSLAKRAHISGRVRPHGLRHTAITALLDSGAGLRETQRFSRHADPRTLMRYDDNRTDIAGEIARTVSWYERFAAAERRCDDRAIGLDPAQRASSGACIASNQSHVATCLPAVETEPTPDTRCAATFPPGGHQHESFRRT